MKIGMFGQRCTGSRLGGIDVVVTELSRCMAEWGHQVICYDRRIDTDTECCIPGIHIKKMPTVRGKGLSALSSGLFAAICSGFSNVDVVHIHGEGPAFFCWIPRLMGKQVVVTIHGLDWKREKWQKGPGKVFIRWGERMAVRYAQKIIVLSKAMQNYFMEIYGRETAYIPNGIETALPAASQIISQYGLSKNSYLLFLGRLVPEKGIHYLISAYKRIDSDKKLIVAGCGSDSDAYVYQLRKMAETDKRILFAGFVQGRILQELYSNAYLYILPSDIEGMPISLLEAMAYGCCCLASDIPECTEVLGGNGFVFPAGDVSALEKQLQILCDEPELVYRHQKEIVNLPSWEEITIKTLEQYK